MERTTKIFKRSFQTLFQNYQYFTVVAAFLLLPVSISVLLSQAVDTSSVFLLSTIRSRLQSLFDAAGFPPFSKFFILLNIKLSQTISSSIFTLPFTLSFFLVAKAAIIQALLYRKSLPQPPFSSFLSLYIPLLLTYLCNSLVIVSTHAIGLCILFLLFNSFDAVGYNSQNFHLFLSSGGAVLYSIILAQTLNTCNLALVVAGIENCSGFLAILKAYILIRGKASTALSLGLPVNLGLAFLEALFQYKLIRGYHFSDKFSYYTISEGLVIAFLYSFLIINETIISCIFYKSCKSSLQIERANMHDHYRIQLMEEEDDRFFTNSKISQEFP